MEPILPEDVAPREYHFRNAVRLKRLQIDYGLRAIDQLGPERTLKYRDELLCLLVRII